MKVKRLVVYLGIVSLLLLVEFSVLLAPTMLPVFAIGCPPYQPDFMSAGPYSSSLRGFADVNNRTVGNQVISVFTVEPGSIASFKVAYSLAPPRLWEYNVPLQPIVELENASVIERQGFLPAPAWLNFSSEPSTIVVNKTGQVNVTVTLQISSDAPPGEYKLVLSGWTGNSYDFKYCPFAPLYFILNVSPDKPATVTTSTAASSTITKTSTETVTRTSTYTTAIVETVTDQAVSIPSLPSNSSAIVWSRLLLSNSLLLKTSIDKFAYSPGETMHLKSTLTNLTPQPITVQLIQQLGISGGNDTLWIIPEASFPSIYLKAMSPPLPKPSTFTLNPKQTITLDGLTRDWNMTGLHVETGVLGGTRAVYDNHPLPEGRYIAFFTIYVDKDGTNYFVPSVEQIPFEISKTAASDQNTTSLAYIWASTATIAAVTLAVVLLLQRRRTV